MNLRGATLHKSVYISAFVLALLLFGVNQFQAKASVSIKAVTADSLCPGDTIRIYAESTRISGVSFTWADTTGASTLNPSSGDTISVFPMTSTVYRVIADSSGVMDTAYISIKTLTPPSIMVAANDSSICPGDSVQLWATGASSYSWTSNMGMSGMMGDTIKVGPAATTHYYATGTDTNGCRGMDTLEIVVNSLPTVKITRSDSAVCNADTVYLYGSGAQSYSWKTSQSGLDKTGDTVWYTVTVARSYYVAGTDSNGCIGRDTTQVAHKLRPREGWNAFAGPFKTENLACNGDQISFQADHGRNTYMWSPTSVVSSPTGQTVTATLTGNTDITLVIDSSNGCSRTFPRRIFVLNSYPPLEVTFDGQQKICEGESTVLRAAGGTDWNWSPATGLNTTSGAVVTATLNSTQSYTVTAIQSGCLKDTTVTVTVDPKPDITLSRTDGGKTLCRDESTEVTITSNTGVLFDWGFGVQSTDKVKQVAPGVTTVLKVKAFSSAGCPNNATILIEVDSTCGNALNTNELSQTPSLNTYQNATGELVVEMHELEGSNFELQLIDMTGRSVVSTQLELESPNQTLSFDVGTLQRGFYLLRVVSGDQRHTKKIYLR